MIRHLARLGRFNTVFILMLMSALTSLAVTLSAVTLLNHLDFGLQTDIASMLAVGVALVVTLPFAWYLIDLLLRVHRDEQTMRSLASYDSLTGLLSRHAFFDNANTTYRWQSVRQSPFQC